MLASGKVVLPLSRLSSPKSRLLKRSLLSDTMWKSMKSNFISSDVLDRPKYKVVKEHDGFEERRYEPSVWVTVDPEKSMDLKTQNRNHFWTLFNYIQGENKEKQKVEMTVPVIRKIVPGAGPACESKVDMSFFVPHEFHDKPPEPSRSDVKITKLPAMTVYASIFGGYPKNEDFLREMESLAEKIPDKENVEETFHFTAGYNSPWQFFNRRNEVWFVKKEQSVESEQAAGHSEKSNDSQGEIEAEK